MLGTINNLGLNETPAARPALAKVATDTSAPRADVPKSTFREALQKSSNVSPTKINRESEDTLAADEEESETEDRLDPREVSAFTPVTMPVVPPEAKIQSEQFGLNNDRPETEALAAAPAAETTPGRQKELQDFLRTMQDKLGIKPERIVKAFAKLNEREMRQPPAQSVNDIVANLGLTQPQAAVAKHLFESLIASTEANGEDAPAEKFAPAMVPVAARIEPRVPSDQHQFFKPGPVEPARQAEPVEANPVGAAPVALRAPTEFTKLNQDTPENGEAAPPNPIAKRVAPTKTAPTAAPLPVTAPLIPADVSPAAEVVSARAPNAFTAAPKSEFEASEDSGPEQDAPSLSARSINEMLGALKAKATLEKSQNEAGRENAGDEDRDKVDPSILSAHESVIGDTHGGHATFESQLAKPVVNGAPVTMPELLNNAQIMIKEGGGEMKVTMSPEGLGEIAMKVSVEHGKVNVTMLTQSDETKQVLERQLGDLRSSLAGTHLHAGEIKVGIMSDAQPNLDRQFDRQAEHQHRDPQPHAQNGGAWERGGGAREQNQRRAYQSYGDENLTRAPLAARALAGQSALNRTRQLEGARRLNLVA